MKKEQRLPSRLIGRLLGTVVMVISSGCATLTPWSGKRPELALRAPSSDEEIWRHTLRDWYPGWRPPRQPVTLREGDASPTPTAHEAPPNRVRVRAAAPPQAITPRPMANAALAAPPLPAPVFDLHHSTPPAAREAFTLIPAGAPANGRASAVGSRYTVRKGDTLSSIAAHVYGDAGAWRRIYDANRDRIPDPNRIKPGVQLHIP